MQILRMLEPRVRHLRPFLVAERFLLAACAATPCTGQTKAWITQFGTVMDDDGYAAAPDGAGGMYLGGATDGSLGSPTLGGSDAWLARYTSAGNRLWIKQFGTSRVDSARCSTPDGAGGAYLGGYTYGSLGAPNSGAEDVWLARFDSAGNQLWTRQLGTGSEDYMSWAAPDGAGGVYVGGSTEGSLAGPVAGGRDAWLAHYTAPASCCGPGSLAQAPGSTPPVARQTGSAGCTWAAQPWEASAARMLATTMTPG